MTQNTYKHAKIIRFENAVLDALNYWQDNELFPAQRPKDLAALIRIAIVKQNLTLELGASKN